ncbi:MAG TPA: hypothetical protein VGV36_04385, partial [Solirubrobacteraceae bacterium]|nr:hypothetical protein [Solirubrobacteraceae bacterium]
ADLGAALPACVRVEVRPAWAFRLPGGTLDGLWRRRGGVLERLVVVDGATAVVRSAQPARERVVLGAWAHERAVADHALGWVRWALGVDEDLRAFHDAHRWDPWIGPAVRRRPWLRVTRRPPFEALAWAVCEQLIELVHAAAIQRRIVAALGPRCATSGLRAAPWAAARAGCAPARLESWDLAPRRALTLVRVARQVAHGWIDPGAPEHERTWARLRAVPGVGTWTVDCLALHGQGRYDVVPAGDLNFRKLLGRARSGGDPAARVSEEEVREAFVPYGRWAGLAGAHVMAAAAPPVPERARRPAAVSRRGARSAPGPGPGGTRWSAPPGPRAAE